MTTEAVLVKYDEILKDTGHGGAKLLRIDEDEVWVPNSLILARWEADRWVEVPRWFAEKEGLV